MTYNFSWEKDGKGQHAAAREARTMAAEEKDCKKLRLGVTRRRDAAGRRLPDQVEDPRRVAHHWQAIYRQAFYRGGPVLTSALSGIDMALWDIPIFFARSK